MLPNQKSVLIIEDEPDTAEMIAEMIRLSGYQAIKSFGGTPAISMIIRQEPDAVILDMMMPDLSGLEVLRIMRLDPRMNHIPVIVVSAKSRPEDIQEGMNAGAVAYLTKPVGYKDLQAAVQKVVS
jgi:CheY-like chemotaxis protein